MVLPEVRLIPLQSVKPYVKRNKTDAADAEAVCEAVTRPNMRFVPIGADGYRFSGHSVCDNPPVRGDHLEEAVWDQVKVLLEDPSRVADEYRRRLVQVRDETREPDEIVRLECVFQAIVSTDFTAS
ncbi:hypothetical protein X727_33720 [Mesorhizobium sp. L103C119B0]|nr:hypothetical protein X727_33720 [Mesorhizobium sp. L103C119B0]